MKKPTELSYEKAFQELKTIVEELEKGEVNVDFLVEKVKRATLLSRFLWERLRKTEEEIQAIFAESEKEGLRQ
ncbi:MAG: exodeoxyribonuclease VII small subunit [Candidatus Atribacteria bacterium]|nr:exodeoxyribonuclease VII small subunit [Candidatus Atribacteria bacterium]